MEIQHLVRRERERDGDPVPRQPPDDVRSGFNKAVEALPQEHLRAPVTGDEVNSPEEALHWFQNYAFTQGFALVTASKRPRRIEERKGWVVGFTYAYHTHPPLQNPFHYACHRSRIPERAAAVDLALAHRTAGLSATESTRILDQHGLGNCLSAKEFYNLSRSEGRRSSQEALDVLLTCLEFEDFRVRCFFKYLLDDQGRQTARVLEHLFFCSSEQIRLGRRFVSGFLMQTDATFNTNCLHLPLSVIVGITNTGKTFPLAFAFITSESAEAFEFVNAQLAELVCSGVGGSKALRWRQNTELEKERKVLGLLNEPGCPFASDFQAQVQSRALLPPELPEALHSPGLKRFKSHGSTKRRSMTGREAAEHTAARADRATSDLLKGVDQLPDHSSTPSSPLATSPQLLRETRRSRTRSTKDIEKATTATGKSPDRAGKARKGEEPDMPKPRCKKRKASKEDETQLELQQRPTQDCILDNPSFRTSTLSAGEELAKMDGHGHELKEEPGRQADLQPKIEDSVDGSDETLPPRKKLGSHTGDHSSQDYWTNQLSVDNAAAGRDGQGHDGLTKGLDRPLDPSTNPTDWTAGSNTHVPMPVRQHYTGGGGLRCRAVTLSRLLEAPGPRASRQASLREKQASNAHHVKIGRFLAGARASPPVPQLECLVEPAKQQPAAAVPECNPTIRPPHEDGVSAFPPSPASPWRHIGILGPIVHIAQGTGGGVLVPPASDALQSPPRVDSIAAALFLLHCLLERERPDTMQHSTSPPGFPFRPPGSVPCLALLLSLLGLSILVDEDHCFWRCADQFGPALQHDAAPGSATEAEGQGSLPGSRV
ncbi:MULE transposase domain-containing protein [Hirsutella rhossiliensis]|uniref:MULE transposase domain-containing protein n=1 Tax=Hirsutella rhossiliensis TaxID=111463 RepID=A0A9P8MSC1_9HYPO|nr:MULE transposase domain-containing protein [Hirsutella rhossiliensis]KAH0959564.1 MULE transposase domain-containing protein [Hirsutella rhossiliensis]